MLLVANSVFLVTHGLPAGLVAPMQSAHVWLGWALTGVLVPFIGSHVWLHRRHRNASARNVGLVVAGITSVGCVAGGVLWSMKTGPGARGVLLLHEGAFVAALAAYLAHRLRARVTPVLRAEWFGATVVLALAGGLWLLQRALPEEAPEQARSTVFEPGLSNARLQDGHLLSPRDLTDPDYCAECHPSVAARWESSAHRHSSLHNPFYLATLELGQRHRTPDQMKFCGGCHDPALLLTGRMDAHPTPQTPGADEGITCLACHAVQAVDSRIGNGSYRIGAVEHYPGFGTDDPDARALGARLIRTKPAQHKASMAPEHLRSAEACLPCHKAHIPEALNGARWLAGQNDYDPWFDSGAGGQSARTFFPPAAEPKRCQDCHMPKIDSDDPAARDGQVADHAFLGANTALPVALGDDAWARRNAEFLQGVVTVDIGAVEVGHARVLTPSGPLTVPAEAVATVDVVVRNVGSGHLFPGGIADMREVWLEATLASGDGALLVSGWVDDAGNLDPSAHRWNSVLLTPEGERVTLHDVERASVVLTARRIMLGASDVVRLEFAGPATPATLTVRVLHRKFPQFYVDFALGEHSRVLPSVVMGEASLALRPGPTAVSPPAADAGPRLRNLGIGHLLRGDTALAQEAARAAAQRMPDDPGPPMDLARAALGDGALDDALAHVRTADAIEPGHPTAAWLLARVRSAQGNHVAALEALAVARSAFPRDRELLAMEANILFKLERDGEAAQRLEALLDIDPDHVTAHALLRRIRAAEGDEEAAARHEAAWNRVRPASADKVATERARREDPELDRRANRQYVLPLSPPKPGHRPAAP